MAVDAVPTSVVPTSHEEWREATALTPERDAAFTTLSGEQFARCTPRLTCPPSARRHRPAGRFPFTRGVYPSMYRGRLWTMRQFAGFGTAEETNERFRYLLDHGQTGLSTAFDMPSLMGHDSDPRCRSARLGARALRSTPFRTWRRLFAGSRSTRSPCR